MRTKRGGKTWSRNRLRNSFTGKVIRRCLLWWGGVAPAKGHLIIFKGSEPVIGDSDSMGVTAKIVECKLGTAKGSFAIDNPLLTKRLLYQFRKNFGCPSGFREFVRIRSPSQRAYIERVIGTIRRECLDWLIPLSESHLRCILKSWIAHYNFGRPHMALGPGLPDPPLAHIEPRQANSRHRRGESYAVHAKPILGGLHHEYLLAPARV
jgi:integrase-like protein